LGTKRSGFFWAEYKEKLNITATNPTGRIRPMTEILAEQQKNEEAS
jgi:hypothetical protein